MELPLNEEQALLRQSAAALCARAGGDAWPAIAEAGWIGLLTDAGHGGAGLGVTELALVLEQAGRALVVTPLGGAAAAARAIAAGESDALRRTMLPEILAGRRVVVPAFQEGHGAIDPARPATRAVPGEAGGLEISGVKDGIAGLDALDGALVNAASDAGPVLVYVARDAPGVRIACRAGIDSESLGGIVFERTRVPPGAVLARGNAAGALIDETAAALLVGTSAELLGVMGKALDIAVAYSKVRRQFGAPIGGFQALQHKAVNDYVGVEVTRSLLFQVAAAIDEARASPQMTAALKAKASGAALGVTKSAIQMHGAIGFTDEHEIGRYFKRAMTLSARHGNEAAHRARYAALAARAWER